MFSAVGSARSFRLLGSSIGIPFGTFLRVLQALKSRIEVRGDVRQERRDCIGEGDSPVEKSSAKGSIEVLAKSSHRLLKNVHLSGTFLTLDPLRIQVVTDDLINRVVVGQGNQLLIFCHMLPIIYQHSLQEIRHHKFDRRPLVKSIFLFHPVNKFVPCVQVLIAKGKSRKQVVPLL